MTYLAALIVIGLCFAGMAIGFIIRRKALQKGCGLAPEDCACAREGKNPDECDQPVPNTNPDASGNPSQK